MQDKNYDGFFDEDADARKGEKDLMAMIDAGDKQPDVVAEVGSKVKGKVLTIGTEYAFVDIGGKNEAMMSITEITSKDGKLTVGEGDTVEAYVVSDRNDEIMLSSSLGGHKASSSELVTAMKNHLPVQGKVTGVNKGGFNVNIMGHKSFCPMSHIDTKYVDDPNEYLSRSFTFQITRISEGGRNVVVSRLPLLEKQLDEVLETLASGVEKKTVLKGTVSRIADFGLFVDVGGIEGLVHISEVSWERAQNLSESFSVGQSVECVVLKVERREPVRESKISLSIRHVGDDPWHSVAQKLGAGDSVEGAITRLTSFGAFVQLLPGIEGLIHISEMRWGARVQHPSDVVSEGQRVTVTVLAVDEAKRSVSCSLKDTARDPWNDAADRFAVGSTASGTVASKTRYGYFVDLDEGVTGLLVYGNVADDKKDTIKVGDTIQVGIESVDSERRRMSLTYGTAEAKRGQEEAREYLAGQKRAKSQPASEFAEKLRAALGKRRGGGE